jgi:hypothetical protein
MRKGGNETKVLLLRITASELFTLSTMIEVRLRMGSNKLTVLCNLLVYEEYSCHRALE